MNNINERIINQIKMASIDLQNIAREELNRFNNLTQQQAVVLRIINEHAGMNQKQLAEILNRRTASVSSILKTLENKGLVERKISPDSDREKQLFLTTAGQTEALNVTAGFENIFDKVGNRLNQDEKVELSRLLAKLIQSERS